MILITHPDNEGLVNLAGYSVINHPVNPLDGVQIQYNEHMEPRNIEHHRKPPAGGRFIEFGSEDEVWMRPLKLGIVYPVDCGPLFYVIDEPKVNLDLIPSFTKGLQW